MIILNGSFNILILNPASLASNIIPFNPLPYLISFGLDPLFEIVMQLLSNLTVSLVAFPCLKALVAASLTIFKIDVK